MYGFRIFWKCRHVSIIWKFKKFMKAYHLREGAKSTRVYCNLCFSVLGVDFPGYLDNVFMFFKDHCDTSFDVAQLPVAAINMNDLADLSKVDVPPDVPVFHSFHFRQEYSIENNSNLLSLAMDILNKVQRR